MGEVLLSLSVDFKPIYCSGDVSSSQASARIALIVLMAILSSTAVHLVDGLHIAQDPGDGLDYSNSMASVQMTSSRLMCRLMELWLTLKARASRSLIAPRSMVRQIL